MREPDLQGAHRCCEVFARVRAGDAAGIANLFADDGEVSVGNFVIEGRDAIRAFYEHAIATAHPQPQVESVYGAGASYVVILEAQSIQGRTRAAELFALSEGGIRSLEIFSRTVG